jgi:hypothetical protein
MFDTKEIKQAFETFGKEVIQEARSNLTRKDKNVSKELYNRRNRNKTRGNRIIINIMYGYVNKIEDTPNENFWTQSREIEMNDGTIVYGCEGDFDIEQVKGQMFTKENFLIWLGKNAKQEETE